ncbi:MAG TPA: hypothetical protein ENN76_00530, partial [Euryarchaeota archaeon]|nr:hypothetical protein [Euryarchaeota archaeon]
FEENSEDYLGMIEKEFPAIKEILIDERNNFMVRNIIKIGEKHQNIVAFVGDAHVVGMARQLGCDTEVIRLKKLREMKAESNSSFSIKFGGG